MLYSTEGTRVLKWWMVDGCLLLLDRIDLWLGSLSKHSRHLRPFRMRCHVLVFHHSKIRRALVGGIDQAEGE